MRARHGVLALVAVLLCTTPVVAADQPVFEGPAPRADCGPGSDPETPGSLQGEVTVKDRDTGRSKTPYTCNLEQVGNDPGQGASWQHTWYGDCAYYDTRKGSGLGVQVIDVSDPTSPKTTTALTSRAMIDPWESLSVNQPRGLLAGVDVGDNVAYFDVYDVKPDCKHPKLLFSGPASGVNHEGDWAPDGKTYYSTNLFGGTITAIDVSDPTRPVPIAEQFIAPTIHGLSVSNDGNRIYQTLASVGNPNGVRILDSSDIQARRTAPQFRTVGEVSWTDGAVAQHTIPLTIQGRPYLLAVDEGGAGAARIIDIADETQPRVVSKLKLEIHMPPNKQRAAESSGQGGSFGYNAHYCNVDRRVDPTIVVCSMFQSGMRVFDIRDLLHPREIAYFNPGGTGQDAPPGSQDGSNPTTTGYPSARPRIIPERAEVWFTDQNKGFFVARFTNGVWPFQENAAGPTPAELGLPAPPRQGSSNATCLSKRSVSVTLPSRYRTQARSATLLINGRAVKRVHGKALGHPIAVRMPAGHSVLRIVVQTRTGKRFVETREYTRCSASSRACGSRRSFTIRLPVGLRSARVLVDGKRVRVLPGRRLRARINLRGRRSPTVHVKVTGVDRNGRTVISRRTYHPCAKHAKRG